MINELTSKEKKAIVLLNRADVLLTQLTNLLLATRKPEESIPGLKDSEGRLDGEIDRRIRETEEYLTNIRLGITAGEFTWSTGFGIGSPSGLEIIRDQLSTIVEILSKKPKGFWGRIKAACAALFA